MDINIKQKTKKRRCSTRMRMRIFKFEREKKKEKRFSRSKSILEVAIDNEEKIRKTLKIDSPSPFNKDKINMFNYEEKAFNADKKQEQEKENDDHIKNLLLNAVSNIEDSQKSLTSMMVKKVNKNDFEKWQKDLDTNTTHAVSL